MNEQNDVGQALGPRLSDLQPSPLPQRVLLQGEHCRIEPIDVAAHLHDLFAAISLDAQGAIWTYLPDGPFPTLDGYRAWLEQAARSTDRLFFAVVDQRTGRAVGTVSYLRMDPINRSIEVGYLCYSPLLQRSTAATEAMYLMMGHAFQLGYRRYEWKCNALNRPSRAAAVRLGFSYEGIFRQHMISKGRSRDTAWYSVIDGEWPPLRRAFQRWLAASNFDSAGRQRESLASLTRPLLTTIDPLHA